MSTGITNLVIVGGQQKVNRLIINEFTENQEYGMFILTKGEIGMLCISVEVSRVK